MGDGTTILFGLPGVAVRDVGAPETALGVYRCRRRLQG